MWRIHLKGVAYTSSGGGVYVQWGWRIRPVGVAYTSNGPIRPKGRYINGMVITSTTPWKPRNVKIFKKVRNWRNWILSVPRVSVCREKKSPWLRQYQSYISNWYVNGKVFTSTTTREPKNLIFFFKKVRNWIWLVFWLVLKSWNHSSRSQHASMCRHRGCIVVPLRVDI